MSRSKAFTFNAAQEAARAQAIDNAETPRYAPSGRAITFAPVLRFAGGAAVNLGSGSGFLTGGRYIRSNGRLTYWFFIGFGTGMSSPGNPWTIDIPFAYTGTAGGAGPFGNWRGFDASTQNECHGVIYPNLSSTATAVELRYVATNPSAGLGMGSNQPWIWTQFDTIQGAIHYEVDDGYTP